MALFKKDTAAKTENKKSATVIVIISITAVLLLGLLIGYLYYDTRLEHDNILDQVSVAGVDVGGMTKAEAVNAVRRATSSTYTAKPLTIKFGKDEETIPSSVSGASLDVEAAIDAAHAYGRQGFVFRRKYEQYKLTQGIMHLDITKYLHLNKDAIRAQTDHFASVYNCAVVQSTFRVEGQLPDDDTQTAGDRTLYVTLGTPGYKTDSTDLFEQVMDAYNQNDLYITACTTVTEPDALDLDGIYRDYCLAPVDAVMDKETFEITDEKLGFGFHPSQVQHDLDTSEPGETCSFSFYELKPNTTRADIEAELFKDVLSEYTAESSSLYNRDINLKLSCQAVNGTILLPGQVFDYNSALGERTPEKGYRLGNTYSGNETIQTYGGGICQTSSTIYYCALMADLEIVTRTNHSFLNTYVPYGMDATVNWGTIDFQFKNNSQYPIKIEAYSDGGDVTVRFLGTDYKDYYVKMEYEIWGVTGWKTVEQELPPDNPKGYKDGEVISTPYTGYTVQTFRCKYDKATNTLISRDKEAYSVYSKRDKVICKIVEPTPPADSSVPTTGSSTPSPEPADPVTPPADPATPPADTPAVTP